MPKRSFVLATSLSLLWFAGCSDLPSRSQQTDASTQVESSTASSPVVAPAKANYELRMHQLHTGESIDVVYRRGNQYLVGAIAQLNHFLRDYRTGQDAHYPVREFDLLHALMQRLGRPKGVIDVVCGYRSPWSNQFLRSRGAHTGVAEHSEHILSQAVDIRVPGVSTIHLRDAALSLAMGGVGYYPRSGFVHVDIGPVRSWSFGGGSYVRTAHQHLHTRRYAQPA